MKFKKILVSSLMTFFITFMGQKTLYATKFDILISPNPNPLFEQVVGSPPQNNGQYYMTVTLLDENHNSLKPLYLSGGSLEHIESDKCVQIDPTMPLFWNVLVLFMYGSDLQKNSDFVRDSKEAELSNLMPDLGELGWGKHVVVNNVVNIAKNFVFNVISGGNR